MSIQSQQRCSFKRIIDGRTLSFTISANYLSQVMSKDPTTFNPDFTSKKLVLNPILTVAGGGGENQVTKSCKWWLNGVEIVGTNTAFGATVSQTAPYALTIAKNLVDYSSLLVRCDYEYVIPATGLTTNVSTQTNITRVDNSGTSIIGHMEFIDGDKFQTIGGVAQQLRLKATMIRGGESDVSFVSYKWYIRALDGSFKPIIAATAPAGSGLPAGNLFSGYTSQTISVSSNAILNIGVLKCEITDNEEGSSTKGKIAVAYATLFDLTDEYKIRFDFLNGDAMSEYNEVGLKLRVDLFQGTYMWKPEDYNNKALSFYRETADETKDATFNPTSADFPGWSVGTGVKANEVSRSFSGNSGTPENRTIIFLPKFMRNDMISTNLMWALDF